MAIRDIQYGIVNKQILFQVYITNYTSAGLKFGVITNSKSYLTILKLTYMALDNLFTPAFSMNRFFPVKIILFRLFQVVVALE